MPRWNGWHASVPGIGHLARGTPCQDATAVGVAPRPWLLAADGMGSSTLSQWGSREACNLLPELIHTYEPLLELALDGDIGCAEAHEAWQSFAKWTYRQLVAKQHSLVHEQGGCSRDYRFTLACAVIGTGGVGILQVGDALMLTRRHGRWEIPFPSAEYEFANHTRFVGSSPDISPNDYCELLPIMGIDGLLAITDGVSTQAFDHQTRQPAPAIEDIWTDARSRQLSPTDLLSFLAHPTWNASTTDDRGLALLCPA